MNSAVKTSWQKVKAVRPLTHFKLQIALENGSQQVLDLENLIARREVYWRLRQPRYFRMVKTDELSVICWPEGEDIAPESIERYRIVE